MVQHLQHQPWVSVIVIKALEGAGWSAKCPNYSARKCVRYVRSQHNPATAVADNDGIDDDGIDDDDNEENDDD